MKTTFRGHDELTGIFSALLWTTGATIALVLALTSGQGWWTVWLFGVLTTPLVYFGARYRVDVDAGGVKFTRYYLWPLIWRRERYYLDCAADLYEAWDSDRPEGVYLDTGEVGDWECFGPYFDGEAMAELAHEVNLAIDAARREVEQPRPLMLEGARDGDFEVEKRSVSGVPMVARNRRPTCIEGIEVPAGSTFEFNAEGWVDPARADLVRSIDLASATVLPGGLEVGAGADLWFGTILREYVTIRGGLSDIVRVGDWLLNGTEPITVDLETGELRRGTLGAPTYRGDVRIPAGSAVHRTVLLEPVWRVDVGAPLRVARIELHAEDSVTFDDRWRPLFVSLRRRTATVDGVELKGILTALPIRRGRLDVRACKRNGLVSSTS